MKTQRAVLLAGLAAVLMAACDGESSPATDAGPVGNGPYDGCRQEGEFINAKVEGASCCEGLTRIEGTQQLDGGVCERVPPDLKVCARCGNGTCGPGESPCNCPADCR